MFEIRNLATIPAPPADVWRVITDVCDYPQWNTFVPACRSSFRPGEPINMRVRVLPFAAMPQRETILRCEPQELIEYGFSLPLRMLKSSRLHLLRPQGETRTRYESVLALSGWLAPVVRLLLGARLRCGFADMTQGIACRAAEASRRAADE